MKKETISGIKKIKEKNNEIVLISMMVAIGVNLVASGIIEFAVVKKNPIVLIIVGILISLFFLFLYSFIQIKKNNVKLTINGLIIYNRKSKKIIEIPEYDISCRMNEYLYSAFVENKALEKNWNKGYLGYTYKKKSLNEGSIKYAYVREPLENEKNNNELVKDLIEYIIIDQIATELTDFFDINQIKSGKIKEIHYDDLPPLLRNNRFLKLFSEDVVNRPKFYSENSAIQATENTYMIYLEKGALYNRFELKLPNNAKIIKKEKNEIVFDLKYFFIKIKIDFNGSDSIVEKEFYNNYLKINDYYDKKRFKKYDEFSFDLSINVRYKPNMILLRKKIRNYEWVDELIKNIIKATDIDYFYENINWKSTKCLIRCLNK